MPRMSDLVWITGASSGIGAALAASVPLNGARVIDVSRSGGTPGAEHLPADLADPSSWAAVAEHLLARLAIPGVDRAVFVHSAGTLDPIGFAGAVDTGAYTRNVLLNAAAPQALGHAFLRAVADFEGRAHLWLLSSGAARTPYPGWSSYGAAKAGVDQWVRAVGEEQKARAEEGRPSCQVLAVAPGAVATPMQERIRATDPVDFPSVGKFAGLHERGELRSPKETATALWKLLDRDLPTGSVVDLRTLARA